jgi:protein phosphatase 2C-like protein
MAAPDVSEEGPVPVEPDSRPERRISEAPTAAPTVGAVRELPDATLGPEIGFRTPAVVLDGVTVGGYCVAAASLAGAAHLVAGSVRQDAYDLIATGTGSLVVVVTDGLGSKAYSQVGARLFCEGVLLAASKAAVDETTAEETAGGTLAGSELMSAGAAHASQVARSVYGLDDNDISVVAAVAVFGTDVCEIVRIGDVSAFTLNTEGQLDELFTADTYCVNEVRSSLPGSSSDDMERAVTQAGMVAVVTDGLASDLRTSPAIRSWMGERWQNPLGPYAMGESLRYRRQGSHDDRTAVVVWANSERASGAGQSPGSAFSLRT